MAICVDRSSDRPCRNPDFAGVKAVKAKKCLSPTKNMRAQLGMHHQGRVFFASAVTTKQNRWISTQP
jgi:hypothetical protein